MWKLSSLINKYECSAVLLWPSHVEHSHPAWGSCAVGTALDYGCRVRLSAVPAMLNSLDRGSYALISDPAWIFLPLMIILLLKISLCFDLAPIELWDCLHAMKYVPKSLCCGSFESCWEQHCKEYQFASYHLPSWLVIWSRLGHKEKLLVFLWIYSSDELSSMKVLVPPVAVWCSSSGVRLWVHLKVWLLHQQLLFFYNCNVHFYLFWCHLSLSAAVQKFWILCTVNEIWTFQRQCWK